MPDGIIISDKNKCVYLNEKAQIMMGQEVRKNYWGQNSEQVDKIVHSLFEKEIQKSID
jgi:hypothetical protein